MSLTGKTVVITGASRGIGAEIAKQALEAGASVVLSGRDEQLLREVPGHSHIRNGRALIVVGDINAPETQQELVQKTVERFGGLDAFVSNAGVVAFKTLQDTTREVINTLFETNIFTPIELTRLLVPHMRKRGRIVYISTSITESGFPYLSAYSASKAAGDAFMRGMAVELAEKEITVNSVAPGPTQSQMWSNVPPEIQPVAGAKILPRLITTSGQFGEPRFVAQEVIHLLLTSNVTGSVRHVDSGYSVAP